MVGRLHCRSLGRAICMAKTAKKRSTRRSKFLNDWVGGQCWLGDYSGGRSYVGWNF